MVKKKRGLSPVVATVLLVSIVIIIGLILFLWIRGLNEEVITKFEGQNIKLACEDVEFRAEYTSGTLTVSNLGNVPIYNMELKIQSEGSFSTKELKEISDEWNKSEFGLYKGQAFSDDVSSSVTGSDKVVLIPVLIGNAEVGRETHSCGERFGYELNI